MQLRDYQQRAVDDAEAFLSTAARGDRRLYSAPTGTGKSVIELALLKEGRYLVTPSLEIIAGMLRKMGRDAPEQEEALATAAQAEGIWTPIRLRNRLAEASVPQPDAMILDECFVAGTLVEGIPIEEIHVGQVLSTGVVTRVFCNRAPAELYFVRVAGRELVSTAGHPYFTNRGWVDAENLSPGDFVLCDLSAKFRVAESVPDSPSSRWPKHILLGDLSSETFVYHDVENESEVRFRENDRPESDAGEGDSAEGVSVAQGDRAPASDSRRERETDPRPAGESCRSDPGKRAGTRDTDEYEKRLRIPDRLQSGYRLAGPTPRDRSGRQQPPHAGASSAGSEEGRPLTWARVDSIEVHERGRSERFASMCPDNRVYNLEVEGSHTYFVEGVLVHNCHHESSDSWQDFATLAANPPCVGFTATPYRGAPAERKKFRETWGEPHQILSLADSVRLGYSSLPKLSVAALLDDDKIKINPNGEFNVESANALIDSRIEDACILIQKYHPFDRPTMLAVPSTEIVSLFLVELRKLGICCVGVTADTSRKDREAAFAQCLNEGVLLVQIKVVSEGVDLPIRRLIDLKPTLSPVAWLQQFGRITRPGGSSEYICCCRNLFRFAYLLDGLVPPSFVATEAQAFGDFSSRSALRSVGLEALGRLKATVLPFADGCQGTMYAVSTVESGRVIEYTIITHPAYPDPICARRTRGVGSFTDCRWEPLASIPIIEAGFASIPARRMSEKQEAWWKRDAGRYGLDASAAVNARSFQALPVLANLRRRFK